MKRKVHFYKKKKKVYFKDFKQLNLMAIKKKKLNQKVFNIILLDIIVLSVSNA